MKKRNIISTLMKNTISSVLIVCMSLGLFNVVPLQANENDVICGLEEHVHTDECLNEQNPCQKQAHTHSEECYKKTEETPELPVEENEPVTNEEPKETENVQIENNKQETEVTIPEQEEVNDTPAEPSDNNVEIAMEGDFEGLENNALHWKLDASDKYGSLLVISGKGPMKDFDASSNTPWNEAISSKTGNIAIKIEEGITRIGNHAFESDCFGENVEISKTVSYIGESVFSKNATKVVFSGINDYVEIKPSAFNQVLKNIEDGKTKFHVDNQGIVYQLNDGETAKVVYASYSDKQSVIIPDHVASCGKIYRINSIGKEAFNQLENLQEITFDKPKQIIKLEDNAFANRFLLNKINGKSNINEIIELFDKNVYQGKDVFLNTSLVQKKIVENKDVKSSQRLDVSHGDEEAGLIISSSSDKWADGSYSYLTGEVHPMRLSFQKPNIEHNHTIRIYFLRSHSKIDIGYKPDETYYIKLGNKEIPMYCKLASTNLIYLELNKSSTEDAVSITNELSCPSAITPGGNVKIWGEIVEEGDTFELPTEAPESCVEVNWTIIKDEFHVSDIPDPQEVKINKDFNDEIYLEVPLSHKINVGKSNASSNTFGLNRAKSIEYTDVLELPEGISWKQEIIEAVENKTLIMNDVGDGYTVSLDQSNILFSIRKQDTESYQYITVGKPNVEIINEDNISFTWTVTSGGDTTSQIKPIFLEFTLGSYVFDFDVQKIPKGGAEIFNKVSTITNFKYNNETSLSTDRQKNIVKIQGEKLELDLTGGNITFFGEDSDLQIHLRNVGMLPYESKGAEHYISLNLDSELYIKTENINKLFEQYKDNVRLNIRCAETSEFQEVLDVDRKTAYKNVYNSNVAYEGAKTINISMEDNQFKLNINGEDKYYSRLDDAFKDIGYAPSKISSTMVLDMTVEFIVDTKPQEFYLESRDEMQFSLTVTAKDTFMMLGEDWPVTYINDKEVTYYNQASLFKSLTVLAKDDFTLRSGRREAYVYNSIYKDGQSIAPEKIKDGDIIDYNFQFEHKGRGTYTNLPMVDEIFGSQILLVPYEKNKANLAFQDLEPLEVGEDLYYRLDEPGVYNNVYVGQEGDKIYNAHTITVKRGNQSVILPDTGNEELNTHQQFTGYHTKIEWMFSELKAESYDMNFTYKVLTDIQSSGGMNYTIGNIAWINDRVNRRIFAQIWYNGTIIDFDKEIVDISSGDLKNPIVDADNHSIINEGDSVTYRLTIENTNDFAYTLSGASIADKLPSNGKVFKWKRDDIKIQVIKESEETEITGLDEKWDIRDKYKDTDVVSEEFQYICWDNDIKIKFKDASKVYIFVTLNYPTGELWNKYREVILSENNEIENTFILLDFMAIVSHELSVPGEAILQKGVYSTGTYFGDYFTQTSDRYIYQNKDKNDKVIAYYIVLYNNSSSRLYVNTIEDILPKGFTYERLVKDYYGMRDTDELWSETMTSSLYNFVDFETMGDVKLKNAEVSVKVDPTNSQKISFKVNSGTGANAIKYDFQEQKPYLEQNEAIVIGYNCLIDESANTDDLALNKVAMPYYDYNGASVTLFDDRGSIKGNSSNGLGGFLNSNDGESKIIENDKALELGFSNQQNQLWLNSDVSVQKGHILPSVTKKTVSYTNDKGQTTPYTKKVHPNNTVNWEVTYENDGDNTLTDYSVYDILPNPYIFTGEITYELHNSREPQILEEPVKLSIEEVDMESKKIVIDGYWYLQLDIYDNKSVAVPTQINSYSDTAICFYMKNKDLVMQLDFPGARYGIPEKRKAKLKVSSKIPGNQLFNQTFINQAGIIPKERFDGIPSNGLVDENKNQQIVYNYSTVNVSIGAFATSYKEVYEIGNESNFASTNGKNTISLLDETKKFRYTLNVENDKDVEMDYLTIIDTLPYEGDHAPFDSSFARNSKFDVGFDQNSIPTVILEEPGLNEKELTAGKDYRIQYSSKTEFEDTDWMGKDSDKWTDNPKKDSKSIRVVLDYRDENATPISSEAIIKVSFNAVVDDENIEPGQVAWNNFGYRFRFNLEDMQNTYLNANPLFVGVKTPSAPILQKKLVDLDGNPHVLTQEEVGDGKGSATFDLIIHKGNALSNYPEDLKDKEITKIQTKVNVDQSESDKQKIYDTKTLRWNTNTNDWEETGELWKWEHGQTYTVLEEDVLLDDYEFYQFEGNPGKTTYTFKYDRAKDEQINLVNMFNRWDIKVVKQDSKNDDIKLNGAVFGLYTSDEKDKIESPEYEKEFSIDGTIWYLKDVQTTDNNGEILWQDLTNDAYYVVELKAPDGYKFPKENKHLVTKTKKEVQVHIDNESGFLIPGTGGSGTNMFVVSGLVIAGIALLLLERKKRRLKGVENS